MTRILGASPTAASAWPCRARWTHLARRHRRHRLSRADRAELLPLPVLAYLAVRRALAVPALVVPVCPASLAAGRRIRADRAPLRRASRSRALTRAFGRALEKDQRRSQRRRVPPGLTAQRPGQRARRPPGREREVRG